MPCVCVEGMSPPFRRYFHSRTCGYYTTTQAFTLPATAIPPDCILHFSLSPDSSRTSATQPTNTERQSLRLHCCEQLQGPTIDDRCLPICRVCLYSNRVPTTTNAENCDRRWHAVNSLLDLVYSMICCTCKYDPAGDFSWTRFAFFVCGPACPAQNNSVF